MNARNGSTKFFPNPHLRPDYRRGRVCSPYSPLCRGSNKVSAAGMRHRQHYFRRGRDGCVIHAAATVATSLPPPTHAGAGLLLIEGPSAAGSGAVAVSPVPRSVPMAAAASATALQCGFVFRHQPYRAGGCCSTHPDPRSDPSHLRRQS